MTMCRRMVLLVAIALGTSALSAGCSWRSIDVPGEVEITEAIAAASTNASGKPLVLESVVPFPFERVYLFSPYTSPKVIRDSLELETEREASRLGRGIDVRDDATLLVFRTSTGTLVSMLQQRRLGDFDTTVTGRGYRRQEAVFVLDSSAGAIRTFRVASRNVQPVNRRVVELPKTASRD